MDSRISLLLALAALLVSGCAASGGAPSVASMPAASRTTLEAAVVDTDGAPHTIAESLDAGRRVALVFWQPWCESCRAESPAARRAHQSFAGSMDVLGVVSGPTGPVNESDVQRAIFEWPVTYPTLRDRDLVLTKAFGVDVTPTIVILEPDGSVSYSAHVPPAEWSE